jgi:hypothetical protein
MAGGLRFTPEQEKELARRRRGRNIALLVALLAVAALFYAIAMVKMAQHGVVAG